MGLLRLLKGELVREVRQWMEDGLVDRGQAVKILERYDTSLDDRRHHSFGYSMLIGLAIFSMGLALLLLISHNWDEIPRAVRMLSLMTLTAGLNGWGLRCYARGQYDLGKRWIFGGSLAYGASIMLIAQIYHLGEHFPDGVFWWALGVLPMALITQSRLLHLLHWALATCWLFAESEYGLATFYPVFLFALAWQLWRAEPSRWLVAALLWGTGIWLHMFYGDLSGARWLMSFRAGHWVVDLGFGLLCYGVSQVLASGVKSDISGWWRDTAEIFNLWLLRGALLMLMIFSFSSTWAHMIEKLSTVDASSFWFLLAFDVLLLVVATRISLPRLVGVILAALVINGLLLSAWLLATPDSAIAFAVIVNVILLASAIRLILRGLELHASYLFYTGVMVVLLQALLRYVNVIGDYVTGSILFLVAGGILFAAARFWQHRMMEREA